ncbi:MAG: Dyp-type peroxidase [Bacteroidota bacterium]
MGNLVELDDVQGLILKGYGNMPNGIYLMLNFGDQSKAKSWLGGIADKITAASTSTKSIEHAINLAFTNEGVLQLGLTKQVLKTFSREFEEGMVTDHRKRMLGDLGDSDPAGWNWGNGKESKTIHACLLVFAKTKETFDQVIDDLKSDMSAQQISIVTELPTNSLPEYKEHFGFRDGIANPVMKDAGRREGDEHPANLINPGEFIFGYNNEYEKLPLSPKVSVDMDASNLLSDVPNEPGNRDLGKNGSMLVFRQMEQNVVQFWEFIKKATEEQEVDNTSDSIEGLASKMIGRWPDGSPLTKCPVKPDEKFATFDNFGYANKDFDGFKCPIGSHIRRTNPRDNFLRNSTGNKEKDIEKSQMFMKRFRILRRGRSYGEPVTQSMKPEDVLSSGSSDGGRGLHFLCFNTSISRQFELIQQTWINNPKFAGLYEDPDPIIGYPEIMGENATTTFTEQASPVRKKVQGIPRFVNIKGGAYFFMPGLKAVKFLASL